MFVFVCVCLCVRACVRLLQCVETPFSLTRTSMSLPSLPFSFSTKRFIMQKNTTNPFELSRQGKNRSALLLTTRSTKVSATRGSREAERSSNTQCGEDNTFSDEPRCASRTRSRKSSNNHNRHGFSNELKCDHPSRAPQNRKCQCELRLHHGEKGRLVIQTRSKSARLHRCLLSTTALKGCPRSQRVSTRRRINGRCRSLCCCKHQCCCLV